MKDPLAQYMSDKPSNDVPEQALLNGKPQKLEDRNISERTCTLYDYLVGVSGTDSAAHIAQYRNDQGVVVKEFNEDVYAAFKRGSDEVYAEVVEHSALAKKIHESAMNARKVVGDYVQLNDVAYVNKRNAALR